MEEKLGASLGLLGGCDAVQKEHSGRGQVYKAEAGHRFCLGDLAKEKTQERELSLGPCNLGFPLKTPGSIPLHFPQNKSWRSRDCTRAPRSNCTGLPL